MIRPLVESDFDAVISIVNQNWKDVYTGYVNQELLDDTGCYERGQRLKQDFINHRLSEYVWEESGQVLGLLSMGATADADKANDFEIWRIYISAEAQGRGIGGRLLTFAEQTAREKEFEEIIIWAFSRNERAIKFYQKYGYQIDKEEYLDTPYLTDGTRLLKNIS
jgi:ribosomal protein S18 acetylase RimI-like enzyme